jgi:hypothetical protein
MVEGPAAFHFYETDSALPPNHVDERGGHDDGGEENAPVVHKSYVQSRTARAAATFDAEL